MINTLAKEIHANNRKKGFYDDDKNIGEMLALIHSEVSETLEADRAGRYAKLDRFLEIEPTINKNNIQHSAEEIWTNNFKTYIKDSFEDELADIVIRVMDLAAYKGTDLQKHIELKLKYNKTRPYKHNKKY